MLLMTPPPRQEFKIKENFHLLFLLLSKKRQYRDLEMLSYS